jgi:hypothetical protein
MKMSTDPDNPTVHEIIDLSRRLLKMSGKLDLRAANLVYKTTTVLVIGKTMLRSYPTGCLEIRRRESRNSDGVNMWGLALVANDEVPETYNPALMDRLVLQLRRILILDSLADL